MFENRILVCGSLDNEPLSMPSTSQSWPTWGHGVQRKILLVFSAHSAFLDFGDPYNGEPTSWEEWFAANLPSTQSEKSIGEDRQGSGKIRKNDMHLQKTSAYW